MIPALLSHITKKLPSLAFCARGKRLFIIALRSFGGAFHLLLRFGRIFFNMFFNCREALRTDIVFNPARVIESCLLIDTEIHQPFGEGSVAPHRSSLRSGGLRRSV